MTMIRVWPEAPEISGGKVLLNARLEGSEDLPPRLMFTADAACASWISELADPWTLAVLFTAMQRGATLAVHGPVSGSLLLNLEIFMKIWAFWFPDRYTVVELKADEVRDAVPAKRQAALLAFSGGVDSCFTALRCARGRLCRVRLAAGLTVHGFDIPLPEKAQFAGARLKASRLLQSLGLEALVMETNVRELPGLWDHTHGAATASALSWFSRRFSAGVVASTLPYSRLASPLGTHLLTDQLLGSFCFPIVHDGADRTRIDKVASLAVWPEAMKNLRVCWEGRQLDRNCGSCEKCIRTKLQFLANGLQLPSSLHPPPTVEQIAGWKVRKGWHMREMESMIVRAGERGLTGEPWFKPLVERKRRLHRQLIRKGFGDKVARALKQPWALS